MKPFLLALVLVSIASVASAQQAVFARVAALARADMSPGEVTSPAIPIPAGTSLIEVRLNMTHAAFNDPGLFFTIKCWASFDGAATFPRDPDFVIPGQGGPVWKSLPGGITQVVNAEGQTPTHLLCTLAVNKSVRMGLDVGTQ